MKKIGLVLLFSMMVAGCTTTQKATTTGAVAGTALGGIIGHQSGNDVTGAAIGGVIGGLGGYIVGDKMEENEQKATTNTEQ